MKIFILLSFVIIVVTNEHFALVGLGSPIVDSVLNYDDDMDLAEQIIKNLSYHMDDNFPLDFYNIVINSDKVNNFLGGSALNTIRMTNYLIKQIKNEAIGFIGSIGNDSNGEFIKKSLDEEKVIFKSEKLSTRTSTAIVITKDMERNFYSDLGASSKISLSYLQSVSHDIKNSRIFYADAYLIGIRYDLFEFIFKNHYLENVILSLCLASDNIIRDYFNKILDLLPYIDLIFLNSEELEMLKKGFNLNIGNFEFIKFLLNYDKKNILKKRIIVNTRGIEDTIIGIDGDILSIPVHNVDKESIIDTNGAGDSFSGGFLAGLLLNYEIDDCVRLGNYVASQVIKLKGFQLPKGIEIAVTKNDL